MAAECCVCGRKFGPDCRSAGAHNCGHTPCQSCVEAGPSSERRCGACRKRSKASQEVVKELRFPGEGGQPLRIWCVDCDALPTDLCLSEHNFCNVQRFVRDSARSVAAMHDGVASGLQRAQEGLQALRTWASGAEGRQDFAALRAHAASLGRIQGAVQQALEDVEEEARRCRAEDAPSSEEKCPIGALSESGTPSDASLSLESGIPPGLSSSSASGTPLECDNSQESSTALESGTAMEPSTPLEPGPALQSGPPLESGTSLKSGPPHESRASLESLPPELLLAVLAYVPTEQLLPLRLLGRRWKTLILEEPLWRHRRLDISQELDDKALYARILRMAPALDTLKLRTGSWHNTQGLCYLKALDEGMCKVRFLDISFGASTVSNKLISRVFSRRNSTLQELKMNLCGWNSSSNLLPALEAIDALKELKTLSLTVFNGATHGFTFKRLRLTNLEISSSLDVNMARDLICLGRETLKTIKCLSGINELKADVVLCKKLTHLAVFSPSCDGLVEVVPQLPHLQSITIHKYRLSQSTVNCLLWAHRNFSGKIHLVLWNFCADDDNFVAESLSHVHGVTLNPHGRKLHLPASVAQFLKSLTAVEQLVLDFRTDFPSLLRSWPASTVPRLQCLSVSAKDEKDPSAFRSSVAEAVKAWRPNLELKFL